VLGNLGQLYRYDLSDGEVAYEEVVAFHTAHPGTRAVVVVDIERVRTPAGTACP
jgi:hypothetical protein